MSLRTAISVLLAGFVCSQAWAASSNQSSDIAAKMRELVAARAVKAPTIDGDLSDEVWASAQDASDFTQGDPDEGKPATQPTSVKVLYDDDAIYFGAKLDDSKPVKTRLGRRDQSLESDWFRVYLDPHFDRRTGAAFWVNPSNVQLDMVLYNDTWDDPDWDAVWSSATKITPTGWTAEIRIPFSQLRFPDKEKHTWGVNFIRRISSNNEQDYLVYTPKNETGFVSRFASLNGIEGIKPKRALELLPYTVARSDMSSSVSDNNPYRSPTEFKGDLGLDLKYGLTSNLTLTGTINPDFGQVEVDPAQVNLSQFELFFPEKRPFFIEGSGLFEFGRGGSNHNFGFNFSQPNLFYSRRIGREPQGTGRLNYDYLDVPRESTILAAAKITGKTESGWTIAALDALTDKEKAYFTLNDSTGSQVVEPMTNYLVTRIAKDLGTKGRVGMLFNAVNRSLDDDLSYLRKSAYTGGVDGYWAFGDRDVILEGFVGGTLVEGSKDAIRLTQLAPAHYYQRPDASHLSVDPNKTSLSGWGSRVMLAKQTGKWKYNLQAQAYSPGFETNDIGFMQRSDAIASHAVILYNNPEQTKHLRERNWWVGKFQNWNFDGDLIANGMYGNGYMEYKNNFYVFASAGGSSDRYDDRSTRGGPVVKRPGGWDVSGGFGRDTRKKFFYEYWSGYGESFEGNSFHVLRCLAGFRPTETISLRFTPSYSYNMENFQYVRTVPDSLATETYGARYVYGEIEQKSFEMGTRVEWTFSSKLSFQLYLQPFIASGDYENFKELAAPRTYDYDVYGAERGGIAFNEPTGRYTVDPDGAGAAPPFSFRNPDFTFRSVRGSAVARWEFRPGSAMYLVWNENRAESESVGDFRFRRDFSAIADAPSEDVFLVKVSYWLPL